MTSDDFDEVEQSAPGDKVSMDELLNKLIIVRPLEFTDKMKTEFKPDGAEAIFADIAVIDGFGGEPWKILRRVLVMQGYLIGAFKNSLNKNLIGTIYQGQRKSGQKPPFMFASLKENPDASAKGKAWMADNRTEFLNPPGATFDDAKPSAETQRAKQSENPYLNRATGFTDEPPF